MRKTVLAIAASALLAAGTLAPTPADAYCRGCGVAAVIGGLAAGAIIGGAIASSPAYAYPRGYYPVAGYEPYPVYYAPPAYGCPGGYWARRPLRDPYGNVVGWSRPRFFCPAY